jgi:hypothetical protein
MTEQQLKVAVTYAALAKEDLRCTGCGSMSLLVPQDEWRDSLEMEEMFRSSPEGRRLLKKIIDAILKHNPEIGVSFQEDEEE